MQTDGHYLHSFIDLNRYQNALAYLQEITMLENQFISRQNRKERSTVGDNDEETAESHEQITDLLTYSMEQGPS